ncbi:MAG: YitT family protein [Bacteroidales bacterium]|nr:YitT family protein [Bacteroidales bacterium]
MNPIYQFLIHATLKKQKKSGRKPKKEDYKRVAFHVKIDFKYFLINAMFILIGAFVAGFGLKGFLLPNSFIDGGVTGISLIINEMTGFSISILILLINIPFIILGYSTISRQFALKSIVAISLLALAIYLIPYPVITHDKLLIAAFGGFFLGLGVGLAIRGGAVLDGTEVLAVFISRKSSLSVGNVILIFNLFIFLAGAYFLSVEIALYAILTYFAASKTVDFIVDGIEEFIGVSIVSDQSEEIRLMIIENMGLGCTLYKASRGYAFRGEKPKEVDVVFTVITRLEISKLKNEIEKIDPDAFITMNTLIDTRGGMINKKELIK